VSRLDLTGIKSHHPLGFLAACGLLRSLTEWKGFGRVTLGWTGDQRKNRHAVLDAHHPIDLDAVTQALLWVSKQKRGSSAWIWSTKIDERSKFRAAAHKSIEQVFHDGVRSGADMMAALASDLVADEDRLRSTAFDLTSGNQHLLKSLRVLAGEPETAKGKPSAFSPEAVEETLLGPWTYQDRHHSLGWDPNVQRLHALRGKVPEKDKENRSVRVAVFLASQALPLFPCFAAGSRLVTTGFHRHDNDDWFAWPIWTGCLSLDTLTSLVAIPFSADLRARGVEVVYRCRRAHTGGSEGNYQVFGHPEERPWPVRHHGSRRSRGRR
jgi:hypothetical protein